MLVLNELRKIRLNRENKRKKAIYFAGNLGYYINMMKPTTTQAETNVTFASLQAAIDLEEARQEQLRSKTYAPYTRVLQNWNDRLTCVTIDTEGSEKYPHRVASRYQRYDKVNRGWVEHYDTAEFRTRAEGEAYGKERVDALRDGLLDAYSSSEYKHG